MAFASRSDPNRSPVGLRSTPVIDDWHSTLLPSAVEAIGQTPLVELSRLVSLAGLHGRILAKLEFLNPGFSKKDRIARQMIEDAEEAGQLRRGQTIVELTSGNTGTGLAIVCAVKSYRFVAVMSGNSVEQARMMSALGAGSSCGPGAGSRQGCRRRPRWSTTVSIVARRRVCADQFRLGNFGPCLHRPGSWRGPVVPSMGSAVCRDGRTLPAPRSSGEPRDPCYLVERRCSVLRQPVTKANHPIQGGGYAIPDLRFIDRAHVDGYIEVSGALATETARELARTEGIFAGFSAGANVAAAKRLLGTELSGGAIVVLLNDSGLKYLSTDLWAIP
jgi:cysteine synthase A